MVAERWQSSDCRGLAAAFGAISLVLPISNHCQILKERSFGLGRGVAGCGFQVPERHSPPCKEKALPRGQSFPASRVGRAGSKSKGNRVGGRYEGHARGAGNRGDVGCSPTSAKTGQSRSPAPGRTPFAQGAQARSWGSRLRAVLTARRESGCSQLDPYCCAEARLRVGIRALPQKTIWMSDLSCMRPSGPYFDSDGERNTRSKGLSLEPSTVFTALTGRD